ncbi:MAG: DUF998 domain-containing protein, partial [Candidatus Micrarchaeales archaeon]
AIEIVSMVLYAQSMYPGYNLNSNYISDLGVGATSVIFNPAMIAFGILLVVAACFILTEGKHRFVALGFLISGVAGMGVGSFPETSGMPHIVFADLVFGTIAIMAVCFYFLLKGKLRIYSLIAGIFALLIVISFALILSAGLTIIPGLGHGTIEELLFYDELIWAFVIGICFMTKRVK